MSLRWFCLGLLPYTALTRAASIPDSHVLHEARQSLPQGWEKGNRISQDTTHQVRFGLRQQNLDKGHDCLTNISDPDSPHYGQWWSQDQIRDFFSPSIETSDRIRDWISDSLPHVQGLTQSHNRAWLEVELTNAELESLVHAEFHEYRHISGRSEPAAEEYHVPLRVRDHLDFITPGVALSLGRREEKVHQRSVPEGYSGEAAPLSKRDQEPAEKCNPSAISYTCLNKLYGLPGHPKTAQKGNLHASFLAGGATYNASAVNLFLKTYTDVPENTFPSEWLIDGASPVKGGVDSVGEAHIAIVLAQPIVYPIPSVFLVQDDSVYAHTYATGNGNQMLEAIDSESHSVL
jgi:tripeptidyl-peptidase-1